MPHRTLTLEESWQLLETWSATLANRAKSIKAEVFRSLDPATKLPDGCPSHAAMAELVFRKLWSDLEEVQGAIKLVDGAIRRAAE